MDEQVKEALNKLRKLNPDNLHLKTSANYRQIIDFQSIWWRHTPQAARYYLLHHYWTGTLTLKDDQL